MTRVVAIGYASLDYPAILDGFFQGNKTVLINKRPADAFPRPGGSQLYVGRCLAKAGVRTSIITWVGDDDMGELYRSSTELEGIETDGIAVVNQGSTPVCFLLYQEDGSCGCCFDPGFMGSETLTPQQADLIREADLVCITVGPPQIGLRALELTRKDAIVAWVGKNDPVSFPETLRTELGIRADYIFCNVHEREWIDSALMTRKKPAPLIVETSGTGTVKVHHNAQTLELLVDPLECDDASGAGDTLAGGSLAAVMDGEDDARKIAAAGIEAAHALLKQRT